MELDFGLKFGVKVFQKLREMYSNKWGKFLLYTDPSALPTDLLLTALNDDYFSKPAKQCENVLKWNIALKKLLFSYKFIFNQFAR